MYTCIREYNTKYTQKSFKITTIINLKNNYLLYSVGVRVMRALVLKQEILSTPFRAFAAGGSAYIYAPTQPATKPENFNN